MSLGTLVLIILVLALLGGIPQWGSYDGPGHFYGGGPYLGSGLGLVVVILVFLLLLGRI